MTLPENPYSLSSCFDECLLALKSQFKILSKGPLDDDVLDDTYGIAVQLYSLASCQEVPLIEHYSVEWLSWIQASRDVINNPAKQAEQIFRLQAIEDRFEQAKTLDDIQTSNEDLQQSDAITELVESAFEIGKLLQSETQGRHSKKADLAETKTSIETLFNGFTPWLYQAAREQDKKVIVKLLIESPIYLNDEKNHALQTLLTQLLRNAIFHGIESPTERIENNKPDIGTITLGAKAENGSLSITVHDDGSGFTNQAEESSYITMTHEQIEAEFFNEQSNVALETSIFSTQNLKTGLGMGFQLVESLVDKLDGSFEILSEPLSGSTILVKIPLH